MNITETTVAPPAEARSKTTKINVNVGKTERKLSVIGGAALTARGMKNLRNRKIWPGLALVAAGSMLFYRGKTGHCGMYEALGITTAAAEAVDIDRSITIARPAREVYDFWRTLDNLPKFMRHVEQVESMGDLTSHWRISGPAGVTIEWDAEITDDRPGESLSWKSTDGGVSNEGTVAFVKAPGGRGTEVRLHITYRPPGGAAGLTTAQVTNFLSSQQIVEDLKRLKQILETGEIATAAIRQPGGGS